MKRTISALQSKSNSQALISVWTHFWSKLGLRWMLCFGLLWFCRMLPQESNFLGVHSFDLPFFFPGCQHLLGKKVNSDGLQGGMKGRSASFILWGATNHFQQTVRLLSGAHITQMAESWADWLMADGLNKEQQWKGTEYIKKHAGSYYSEQFEFIWSTFLDVW